MPKLPFKRTPASEPSVLDAYIPSQTVDYTVLPPLENDDAETGLRRLPKPLLIAMVVLPLLLVGFGAWALWGYLTTPAAAPVVHQPPSVTISSARVVSRDAIMVEAQSQHVENGVPVQAQVLVNKEPVDWFAPASKATTVQNGRISVRLQKSDPARTLDSKTTYRVALTVGNGTPMASAQADVAVPEQVASAFYAVATPTPVPPTATPEGSRAPQDQPTSVPSGEPSAPVVFTNGAPLTMEVKLPATVLVSPTLKSAEIGQIEAGASIAPIARSADNNWLLVRQQFEDWQVGWLSAKYVAADANIAAVRSIRPPPAAIDAVPLKAKVGNGGNIRFTPDLRSGTVLGQLHAGQTVGLREKTSNGAGVWYHVLAPEGEGWVHALLLSIAPDVVTQVPVKK